MFSQKQPQNESKDDDFVIVEFPYTLSPYTPYQLNKILKGWLKDKKKEVKTETSFFIDKSKYCAGWILSKQGSSKKIALFNVANYPSSTSQLNKEYPALDESLNAFTQKKINCQKLIVPIAELNRRHFRLLVIEPNKNQAIFYDSKSQVVGMIAEMVCANSLEEYRYIETTCQKYFPEIIFYALYFGDQAWDNHEDCGPHTVEYAFQEILPGSIPSIDQARVDHDILYKKGVAEDSISKSYLSNKSSQTMLFWNEDEYLSQLLCTDDDWEKVNMDLPSPK